MTFIQRIGVFIASTAFVLSFGSVSAALAFTTSCVGVPSASSITWTASSAGGVVPVTFLWGNGSTSSAQTIAVSPGTYSMTLQATDASSTIATSTCMATVAQPIPTISSFIANPSVITNGQNSVLSWVVSNASSTSLGNGIGMVSGSSFTVTPTVTTTYHFFAVNPSGTSTASAMVTVNATSSGNNVQTQIQNLLNQIAALKAQLVQLLLQQQSGGSGTSTPSTTSPRSCFNFQRDLHDGDDGDDVKDLQRTLSSDPSIFPPGLITGFFGKVTENAMKKFQKKFGLFSSMGTATGFFGPKTRGYLKEHCKTNNFSTSTPSHIGKNDENDNNHGESGHGTSTSSSNSNHGDKNKGNSHDD